MSRWNGVDMTITERKKFEKEWDKARMMIFNPKDINIKYNLHGIFRIYADCTTSSGVRYGKVL